MEVKQIQEGVYEKSQIFQDKMKKIFYKNVKAEDFQVRDWVLRWNARVEYNGKHGKFDHLSQGTYKNFSISWQEHIYLTGSEWYSFWERSSEWLFP